MALVKCHEEELTKIAGEGRGIKRCRSSSLDLQEQQQKKKQQGCEKSLCLVACDPRGGGCTAVYAIDWDDNYYRKRSFCKNCSVKLFGEDGGAGDRGVLPELDDEEELPVHRRAGGGGGAAGGLREITPSLKSSPSDMFVSLCSTVYVLGGPRAGLFSRNVFYFDTNKEEEGWKPCPDMLSPRDNRGKAVALDGKMYVFGGIDNDELHATAAASREPWAEVFDPNEKKWKPLTPLPTFMDLNAYLYGRVVTYGSGGPSEEKKILIGSKCYRYVYHVKSGTWEGLVVKSNMYPDGAKPIGIGNVLYWTDDARLHALNMKTWKHYIGKIKGSGLKEQGRECLDCFHPKDPEPTLFHLGGNKFCFFTLRAIRGDRTKVRCFKFEVSKRLRPPPNKPHDYGSLKASVVSRVTYIVDQPYESFYRCRGLLLDAMPSRISGRKCSKAINEEVLVSGKERAEEVAGERELQT